MPPNDCRAATTTSIIVHDRQRCRALFAHPSPQIPKTNNTTDTENHLFPLSLSSLLIEYHPLSALPSSGWTVVGGFLAHAPLFYCLCKLTRSPQPIVHDASCTALFHSIRPRRRESEFRFSAKFRDTIQISAECSGSDASCLAERIPGFVDF